jgi:hypothetical protein
VSINLEKYMTMTATLEVRTGQDEDTNSFIYDAPVAIKCYISGKRKYIRDANSGTLISSQQYTTQTQIQEGDKINGQAVKEVTITADFDGTVQLYKAVCW